MTISASQKLGVARPMMAMERPSVVGGRILANRRVDADRQRYQQPDYDCQDTKLNGYGNLPIIFSSTETNGQAVIRQGCRAPENTSLSSVHTARRQARLIPAYAQELHGQ